MKTIIKKTGLCILISFAAFMCFIVILLANNRIRINKINKSCVSIYCGENVETKVYSDEDIVGSGFICDKNMVMTAYHNLVGSTGDIVKNCYVITYDGYWHRADVVYTDPDFDIAILLAGTSKYPKLKLSESTPRIGDAVYTSCTPKTIYLGNTFLKGSVSNTKVNGLANQYLFMTDMPLSPGCSGSPVVDKYNRVIGMYAFKSTEFGTEGLSFSIYGDKLCKAYKDYKNTLKNKESQQIDYGIEFEIREKSQYGRLNEAGIYVKSISETSVFKDTKLKPGDLILTIDGEDVYTSADFYEKWTYESVIEGQATDSGWFSISVKNDQ